MSTSKSNENSGACVPSASAKQAPDLEGLRACIEAALDELPNAIGNEETRLQLEEAQKLLDKLPLLTCDEGQQAQPPQAPDVERCAKCGACSEKEAETRCRPDGQGGGCPGDDLWQGEPLSEAEIDTAIDYVRERVKGTDREMKPPQAPGGEGAIAAWHRAMLASYDATTDSWSFPETRIDEAVVLMRSGSPAASGEEGRKPSTGEPNANPT